MIKKIGLAILLSTHFAQPSFAVSYKKITDDEKFPKALNVLDYSTPNKLGELSKIKWYHVNDNFLECSELAEKHTGDKKMGVWVAYVHVQCLNRLAQSRSKWKTERLLQSFNKLSANKSNLLTSPYPGHKEKYLELFLDLAESSAESARNGFDAFVDAHHDLVDHMDAKQRARYYKVVGEMAWLRQKSEVAVSNFLRSFSFDEDNKVLKRLKDLNAESSLQLDKYVSGVDESEDEKGLWSKFSTASKKGQNLKIAQYGSQFLNDFPGSSRVDGVRDRINTIYKRLLYRRGKKYESMKKDFEKQLMKAPPQYILFWATEAFERGYQGSSYRLAEKAAEKWEGTPEAAEALILAARTAYYRVNRSEAESFMETLIEKYSGSSASNEARYLLGLLNYREGKYKRVIQIYDSFLTNKGSDQWELQVRYWLWRALKKIESPRASEIAETIFKTFPLTYYGLLVRMEEKKSLQDMFRQEVDSVGADFWWTSHNDSRWKRIFTLVELGWLDEAETEVDFLPDPKIATAHLVRAKLWKAIGRENRAIQDYASAVDLDLNYLTRGYMKKSYPEHYEEDVQKSAKEFDIPEALVFAIIRQESAFMPRAVSPSNAYGLMQMLKPTARETARWLRVKNFNQNKDLFKPEVNVRFGTHFISRMLRKYKGIMPLAIASYNVGPGNLDRWLSHRSDLEDWSEWGGNPDDEMWMDELPWGETSFYVKAVLRNFLLYQIIHDELTSLENPPWKQPKSS